jgi:hypothetical protein
VLPGPVTETSRHSHCPFHLSLLATALLTEFDLWMSMKQFCYFSGRSLITPTELITMSGESWEEQVASIVKDVFTPEGFAVECFSKVPYLCEGDLYENFYVLSDALFVLKPIENTSNK